MVCGHASESKNRTHPAKNYLGAFIATTVAVGILTRELGRVALQVLVGREQAAVATTRLAFLVVKRLLHVKRLSIKIKDIHGGLRNIMTERSK